LALGLAGEPNWVSTRWILPMTPLRTSSQATRNSLLERCWEPVWRILLLLRVASMSVSASWMLCVSGFSQYTSLPAFKAAMAMMACQ
jgi:hypothetical protein